MNAVLGIRPGMGTSLEWQRLTGPERLDELRSERSHARLGDRSAETDRPVVPDLDAELPAGALDRDPAVGQPIAHRRRCDRTGRRARDQGVAGPALPDADLDPIARQNPRELDVGAVGE